MSEEYKSEFIFQLIKPIIYQEGGQSDVTTDTLILYAPSNKQRRQTAELKQGFFRALNYLKNNNNNDNDNDNDNDKGARSNKGTESDEISGTEIIGIIMMSKVDFIKYQETFKELLLNGVAFVSDTQKMTHHIYENMSIEDSEKLMGEYLSNFLLSFSMKALTKK